MKDLTHIATYSFDLFGLHMTVNTATLMNTWLIMAVLIVLAFVATRRIERLPNPAQRIAEVYVSSMDKLTRETLETTSRSYVPLVATIFLFLVLLNEYGAESRTSFVSYQNL